MGAVQRTRSKPCRSSAFQSHLLCHLLESEVDPRRGFTARRSRVLCTHSICSVRRYVHLPDHPLQSIEEQYLERKHLTCFAKKKNTFSYFSDIFSPLPYCSFSSPHFLGFVSCTITNPVWLIKTRLQLDENIYGQRQSARQCIKSVYRNHGIKGFYKVSLHRKTLIFIATLL